MIDRFDAVAIGRERERVRELVNILECTYNDVKKIFDSRKFDEIEADSKCTSFHVVNQTFITLNYKPACRNYFKTDCT